MFEIEKIIGRDKEIRLFRSSILQVIESKRGSIFLIEGRSGFGKSTFINFAAEYSADTLNTCKIASVDCTSPIGDFSLSNLQPLKPIAEALALFSQKNSKMTAKTKFALDIGMSLLSALPLLGEVPYLIKTVTRDYKEYSQNKSTEAPKKEVNSEHKVMEEYAEHFKKLFETVDTPFVLIIDNAHWLDSFSCMFIERLIPLIQNYPFFVVLAYRDSELSNNLPVNQLLKLMKGSSIAKTVRMNPFDMVDIELGISMAFPNSKNKKTLAEWILHNSQGEPSSVLEYIRYFSQNSPFTATGELLDDFEQSYQFPNSVKAATTKIIEQMTDEEVQILCVAAAEGLKFSMIMCAHLLQTDPVSAIRKFRSIQRKYGIIRSVGTQTLYGVQTTCFEFSQTIYFTYFQNILEKEEHDVLHQSITLFLQQMYDNTDDEYIKASIAPYIAAHSIEYGDDSKAQEMIAKVAEVAATTFPSNEILSSFQQSVEQNLPENFSTEGLDSLFQLKDIDFETLLQSKDVAEQQELIQGEIKNLRESVTVLQKETEKVTKKVSNISIDADYDFSKTRFQFLEAISNEHYQIVIDLYTQRNAEYARQFSESEMMFLTGLHYRCLAETGDVNTALNGITELMQYVRLEDSEQQFILLKNIHLLIVFKNGMSSEVNIIIEDLLKLIQNVPNELKNITLSNIEFIVNETKGY